MNSVKFCYVGGVDSVLEGRGIFGGCLQCFGGTWHFGGGACSCFGGVWHFWRGLVEVLRVFGGAWHFGGGTCSGFGGV